MAGLWRQAAERGQDGLEQALEAALGVIVWRNRRYRRFKAEDMGEKWRSIDRHENYLKLWLGRGGTIIPSQLIGEALHKLIVSSW